MGCGSSTGTKSTTVNLNKLHKQSGLPMPFLKAKYEKFQKFDGDGKITKGQLIDLLDAEDDNLQEFLEQMFKAFDTDKSGKMDFNELIMMIAVIYKGTTMKRLEAVFKICDEDRSGRIEKKELKHTFKHLTFLVKEDGIDEDAMEDLAEVTFAAIDKDNNGHLEKDEFLKAFAENERVQKIIASIFVGAAEALVKHDD